MAEEKKEAKKKKADITQAGKAASIERKDIIFLFIGILFAAMLYIFPEDFIYFRFIFFTFVGFQFGSRAGIITTLPLALTALLIHPDWTAVLNVSPPVFMAMLFAAPIIGYIAGRVKKHEKQLNRFTPLLWLIGLSVAFRMYLWALNKPPLIKAPFLFIIAISFYFLFKYRKNLIFIKYFFWLLVFYYTSALLLFFPLTRFSLGPVSFYTSALHLLPGDILTVFLAAVLFPQVEYLINSFKAASGEE